MQQIQLDADLTQSPGIDITETNTWNKLIKNGSHHLAPAAFTPTFAARESFSTGQRHLKNMSSHVNSLHEGDMFLAIVKQVLFTIIFVWETCDDEKMLKRFLFSFLVIFGG